VDCLNDQTITRFATPRSRALDAVHVAHLAEWQLYLWQVRARTGVDRWVESDLVEFTLYFLQEKAGQ
jgi:hypothetical protein